MPFSLHAIADGGLAIKRPVEIRIDKERWCLRMVNNPDFIEASPRNGGDPPILLTGTCLGAIEVKPFSTIVRELYGLKSPVRSRVEQSMFAPPLEDHL